MIYNHKDVNPLKLIPASKTTLLCSHCSIHVVSTLVLPCQQRAVTGKMEISPNMCLSYLLTNIKYKNSRPALNKANFTLITKFDWQNIQLREMCYCYYQIGYDMHKWYNLQKTQWKPSKHVCLRYMINLTFSFIRKTNVYVRKFSWTKQFFQNNISICDSDSKRKKHLQFLLTFLKKGNIK